MIEAEYAQQLLEQGYSVHFHDDVWWVTVVPGFCRPVWRSRCFPVNGARPKFSKSFLGFSHSTDPEYANSRPYQVIQRDIASNEKFSIDSLSSNRRSKVRRGLKRVDVQLTNDIAASLPQMMDVVIDARQRTGAGKPAEFYSKHGQRWQNSIENVAKQKDNFFILALLDNRVVAYFHCIVVEQTMSITAAKSHSDFLSEYPNDALVFTAMDYAYNHWNCQSIIYGDFSPDDSQLNQFKFGYGFQCHEIAQYEFLRPGVRFLKKLRNRK